MNHWITKIEDIEFDTNWSPEIGQLVMTAGPPVPVRKPPWPKSIGLVVGPGNYPGSWQVMVDGEVHDYAEEWLQPFSAF